MRTCRRVPVSPAPYWAQDGWLDDPAGMTRKPRMVEVKPFSADYVCKYDQQHTDAECAGCQRRDKGEA